jgi:hypothetical protein
MPRARNDGLLSVSAIASSGRPVHARAAVLSDLVCWRHLEGRRHRCMAYGADVAPWADVEVAVAPLMRGRGAATGGDNADGKDNSNGNGNERVLAHAARVAAALREAGLSAACCPCGSTTPAATRAALERAGVPIRADVGAREAEAGAEGTVALALHPALELQLEQAQLEQPPLSEDPGVARFLSALCDEGRAEGVPVSAVGEVARRALDAARERRRPPEDEGDDDEDEDDASPVWPPELTAVVPEGQETGDEEEEDAAPKREQQQQQQQQQPRRRGRRRPTALLARGWCDRLHLSGHRRWCAPHLRWLLGIARGPCHCAGALGAHPPLADVLVAAESALARRHWRRQ